MIDLSPHPKATPEYGKTMFRKISVGPVRNSRPAMYAFGVVAAAGMLLIGATALADEPGASKTDPRLAGIWVIESGTNNGQPIPKEELEGARTVVRENAIVSYDRDENVKYRCVYYFDQSKDPNTIDMVSTMQRDKDMKAPGIYKVDEDSWTLCYNYGGSERPEKFESKTGSKVMLLKLKRLEDDSKTQK